MDDGRADEILLVVCRRFKVGVKPDHLSDERVTLFLDLFPRAILARVQPLPLAVVDRLRRGGPKMATGKKKDIMDTFFFPPSAG